MRPFPLEGEDGNANSPFSKILQNGQDVQHDISTTAYDLSTIGEQELKLAYVGGSLYLYTRYNDTIYRSLFTAV